MLGDPRPGMGGAPMLNAFLIGLKPSCSAPSTFMMGSAYTHPLQQGN